MSILPAMTGPASFFRGSAAVGMRADSGARWRSPAFVRPDCGHHLLSCLQRRSRWRRDPDLSYPTELL